jgi:hypothetical protein
MSYTIQDIISIGITKNTIYKILKFDLPISKQYIKNKRIFNSKDYEIFDYYQKN